MPGLGTHVLVSDRVADRLSVIKRWPYAAREFGPNNILPGALADIASRHKNYYALGAVGPDLFFFLPDFRNHLADVGQSVLLRRRDLKLTAANTGGSEIHTDVERHSQCRLKSWCWSSQSRLQFPFALS